MKKTDIAFIILIAAVSIVISYLVSNWIFGNPNEEFRNIKYMDSISGTLVEPDAETFNPLALDPVVEVMIGSCGTGTKWSDKDQKCVKDDSSNESGEPTDENAVEEEENSENQENTEEVEY